MKIENMRRSTEAFDVDLLALDEPMLKAGEAPEDATEQTEADAVADEAASATTAPRAAARTSPCRSTRAT